RLFELVDLYAASGQDAKAIEVLLTIKRRMFADKRQNDYAAQLDAIGAKHPNSQLVMEFWASLYNELNRETQYFDVLIKLFDVYFTARIFRKLTKRLNDWWRSTRTTIATRSAWNGCEATSTKVCCEG